MMEEDQITQDMIDGWRINYGLDKMSPSEAARWWSENQGGRAPAGAVAALGLCLIELERLRAEVEALRKDAVRYRFVRTADTLPISKEAARDPVVYDAAIDASMKEPK